MGVRDELAAVLSAVHGVRLHGEPLDEVFARLIADAEQRGREDNTDHGMCYVHGSKALARLLDEARREAWDEGYCDGRDDERLEVEMARAARNPYRSCDHPGIDHDAAFSYCWPCPKCGVCKFIGHGPLCIDCYQGGSDDS